MILFYKKLGKYNELKQRQQPEAASLSANIDMGGYAL